MLKIFTRLFYQMSYVNIILVSDSDDAYWCHRGDDIKIFQIWS